MHKFNNLKYIISIFVILFFFIVLLLKFLDIYLNSTYGLGNPILYEPSNKHGYLIKPNQTVTRKGNIIKINNRGMRNDENWEINNTNYKILFFGDSVTYGGSIVSNKDLFTTKTCEILNSTNNNIYQCGNHGVNGYNVESITRLIKFRNVIDEDFVVVTLIGNDFERSFHNIMSQPFWNKNIPSFFPALVEVFFIFFESFKNKIKYNFINSGYPVPNDEKYYLYLIRNFNEALELNDKKFAIFYLPESEEIFEIKHQKNNYIKFLLKNNLKNFYDLSEDLKYFNKKDLYHDSVHLNKNGHKIIGKIISSKIQNFLN